MADNIIKVNVTSVKQQRVSVSSSQVGTEITASGDTGRFWAQTAKNWAVSDVIVDNTDFSSKHYAQEAKESANNAQSFENATRETYNSFLETANNAILDVQSSRDEALTEVENTRTNAIESMNTVKTEAIDSLNSTKTTILSDIEFIADGEKKEIEDLIDSGKEEIQELTNEIKDNAEDIINRVSLSMFDTILKDHVLSYEESRGLALQGTYVYKDAIAGSRYGYPDFYNKCLEEYAEAERRGVQTITLGGKTIGMMVHPNGHMYYDAVSYKSAIDDWYNTFGSAWFYGIDSTNQRIFLPRNNWFEQMTVDVTQVGDSVEAGLPSISHTHTRGTMNITGTFEYYSITGEASGAFSRTQTTTGNPSGGSNGRYGDVTLNASQSWTGATSTNSAVSSVYGKSNTVQPIAVKKLLYICVGNTVSNTSWVDVVTQVQGGVKDLEDKTLEGIERLRQSSTALTQSQVTNCLLEVPQRIKLELADGVLTLKAGSEVIVPNGFEADGTTPKFDYVTIESDLSTNTGWITSGQNVLFYNFVSKRLAMYGYNFANCDIWSGNSPTINKQYGVWYNTASNIIKTTEDTGSTWKYQCSLPLAIYTCDSNKKPTSINQVFNGMGYMGSTIWVDKGVKGLIPNGRNKDGTLRNIEFVTDKLKTVTNVSGLSQPLWYIVTSSSELYNSTTDYWIYNNEENLYKHGNNNGHFVVIAQSNTTNGVISNFQPKQPVNLATTDMVDGQWQKLSTHTTILSVNSYGTYEVDLSAFLPKDGYSYEITLWYRIDTQLKINDIYLWYQTSLMHDINIYYAHGGGANDTTHYRSANPTTIPIGIDRKLIFKVNTTATPTNINYLILNLSGYRRLGMN